MPLQQNIQSAEILLMNEGIEARSAAMGLLNQVLHKRKALDQLLDCDPDYKALSGRDRSFVHMLVATCLRRLGQCDDLINQLQDKTKALPHPVKNILRLGMTQILFMEVADHAAVDTSVHLCQVYEVDRYKNLVNALLRRLLRERYEWLKKQDEVRLNIPDWLLKHWIEDWGSTKAVEIGMASLQEAPLDITLMPVLAPEIWAKELGGVHLIHQTVRVLSASSVPALPGFNEGYWWIQDAAAALPANLLGDVKDQRVADLCAAPGGKTAQLAANGGLVTSLDRSANRLKRLNANMQRLGLDRVVETVLADAASWSPCALFNKVLLDAPCTATGVIRRHPDILHLKEEKDATALANTQERILQNIPQILAPGGTVVYCTCSTLMAEGEAQIASFLQKHPDFCIIPITSDEVGDMADWLDEQGQVRIFPSSLAAKGGMDGFFMARLQRIY